MSIIEKALGKVQRTGNRDSYDAKRIPPAPPRGPIVPRPAPRTEPLAVEAAPAELAVEEVAAPAPAVTPSEQAAQPQPPSQPALDLPWVNLDMHALRAAGMLPQPKGELALRNQFRRLKWPLRDAMRQRQLAQQWNANLIMVASAVPGEGKTFTSLNLAMSLAREQDCRVVLVDADVAKGHLTSLMGLSDRPGLLDLLADTSLQLKDVLVATDVERLMVLPAHRYTGNAPELFASKRMEQVMAELAGMSADQIVVFDSSPVLSTNEAQVLGRLMAQILMVVRADHTDRNAVLDAIELLERPKLSFILNQCQVVLGDDYYNSTYGYTGDAQQP
jgi:protein-tyrosine kinase